MLAFTVSPDLGAGTVEAAIKAGDVAAVVLRVHENGAGGAAHLGPLVQAVQAQGAAALLEGPEPNVAAPGLDGVHVSTPAGLAAALKAFKPDAIVGAGGLTGRHDAMEAGESGADYVLFGSLAPAPGDFAGTLDLVSWWAELFEVPCVGVASSLDEVTALARGGADFVLLAEHLAGGPGGPEVVAAAQARLAAPDGAS